MRYRVNPKGGTVCEGGQFAPGSFIELDPERACSLGDSLELGPNGAAVLYGAGENQEQSRVGVPYDIPTDPPEIGPTPEVETAGIDAPPEDRMIRRGRTIRK